MHLGPLKDTHLNKRLDSTKFNKLKSSNMLYSYSKDIITFIEQNLEDGKKKYILLINDIDRYDYI